MKTQRRALLQELARLLPKPTGPDCVLIGIDGVDGVGKTWFANELAEVLRESRHSVIRISGDDFHHQRAHRYRRGEHSAIGFYEDGFDYARMARDVLVPLGKGGSRRYSARAHDLMTDAVLEPVWTTAPAGSTVVLEGLFLHRDDMETWWDCSLLLDAPFEITLARQATRSGLGHLDPHAPDVAKYINAQKLYFAQCTPHARADIVIDNSDHDRPRIATYP